MYLCFTSDSEYSLDESEGGGTMVVKFNSLEDHT